MKSDNELIDEVLRSTPLSAAIQDLHITLATRGEEYGDSEVILGTIAKMWDAYLIGRREWRKLKPSDVAAMMTLLKIARHACGEPSADNWRDAAGYAVLGGLQAE